MRDKYLFSDAQTMNTGGNNLDSTGVVSDDVFDLELDEAAGNTIVADTQVKGVLNVKLTSVGAFTGGGEGLVIDLLASDAAAGTTPDYLGSITISNADLVTGMKKQIEVHEDLDLKFLMAWFRAKNTTITNGVNIVVDCWMTNIIDGTQNEDIQKVPS